MRLGRVFAVLSLVGALALPCGLLISAGGCSGSSETTGQAVPDEEGQKLVQDKMKEFMAKKDPVKGQKKK